MPLSTVPIAQAAIAAWSSLTPSGISATLSSSTATNSE